MQVSNRCLADWMEVFVEGLSKKANFSTETEKTAEVNVNDLKKVVWNDETFHVMFDEDGATIVNDFGNTVTALKGVSTIEEVDKALNSKQIVTTSIDIKNNEIVTADSDIFDEELKKVSSYRVEADDMSNNQNPNPDPNNPNPNPNDPNQQQNNGQPNNGQPQDPNQQQNNGQPNNGQPNNGQPDNGQQPTDQTNNQVQDIANDIDQTTASLDVLEKLSSLETMIANLAKSVTAISEQQYAHQPIPEDGMANQVQQEELNHMNETMQSGQQQLDKEYNTDLTTMEGRVSLIEQLMNDIDMGSDLADDELDELDLPEEIESPNSEENQTPTDEVKPEGEEVIDLPEVGTDEEVVVELPTDEVVEDKPEDASSEEETEVEEPKEDEESTKEDDKEEDKPEEDKKGLGIEKLNSKDSKIFKKHICPHCGEEKMFKVASVNNFVGIYCKDCNTEYAVNTNNEEIFIKKA